MAKYYSFEKGKYGGAVGTIYPFPRTLNGSTPASIDFQSYVPAGYLRCDGSILNADEYVALANVIGVGDDCIYKKANVILENRNEQGYGGQIQLPDLGSKYITAFSSNTGLFLDSTAPNPVNPSTTREKVGIGVDLSLNQGSSLTIQYTGNFSIPTTNIPVSGNYVLEMDGVSASANIGEEQILAHGHYSNATRLVNGSPPSRDAAMTAPGINDVYGGAGGWDVVEFEEQVIQSAGDIASTSHIHSISRTNPTHNTAVNLNTFEVDGSPVTTTVNLASENTTAFNDITQKFILVEYLIKF